jgi:HD-GYP domain-containing protein (c-di-GMP phosphodiesterase class II)
MRFEFLIRTGREAGRTLALATGQVLTVGRLKTCDVHLDDESVSRRHCTIEARETACQVADLSSANGTFVNDELIKKADIRAGDRLRIGSTVLECIAATLPLREAQASLSTTTLNLSSDERGSKVVRRAVDPNRLEFLTSALQQHDEDAMVQSAQRYLSALHRVSDLLSHASGVDSLYESLLSAILDVTGGDRAAVLMGSGDAAARQVEPVAVRVRTGVATEQDMVLSRTIVNDVLDKGISVFTHDAMAHERYAGGQSVVRQGIRSVMCAPMRTADAILGVLYVDSQSTHEFTDAEIELLAAIGNQAGMALHRTRLMVEMERLFLDVTKAIAAIIDAKDGYTHRHSERVAAFAVSLAREMGLQSDQLAIIELSALLHDVGKIGVPDAILNKPDKLTEQEFDEMRRHPLHGARILAHIQNPRVSDILPGVKHHHERWDGSGYPDGLKGEAIPMLGRLLAVADFLDAVTSDRTYHSRKPLDEAVVMLRERAGQAFDPRVVQAALDLHAKGALALPYEPGPDLKAI